MVSNIFLCLSLFGERIQFDEHILQMGWNHQLVWVFPKIWENHQIIHLFIGFSMEKNHPFWGPTFIFGNTHIWMFCFNIITNINTDLKLYLNTTQNMFITMKTILWSRISLPETDIAPSDSFFCRSVSLIHRYKIDITHPLLSLVAPAP